MFSAWITYPCQEPCVVAVSALGPEFSGFTIVTILFGDSVTVTPTSPAGIVTVFVCVRKLFMKA